MDEDEEADACYKRKCSANENCCEGSVCVEIDGVEGECLPADGRSEGERCIRDEDCEVGLFCEREHKSGGKFCQASVSRKKQLNEGCDMSVDCDIEKGLCCQLQRRIRQRAKKVCSYFSDALQCIGPVAVDKVKVELPKLPVPGEKRIYF
ncbi:unnamed protein product [Notodromas monacha]|uniref:Dickkopf N-terminal cysteine-rich domain-containing protein n=1 Tax=Notodromas monacha TaxID=399045 RepID=A0A7R9GGU9_9CRUS|nr:unnamed protein product [Notodromas monacha]CAG0920801.1 unnamed protein product [Notodromas monacha]